MTMTHARWCDRSECEDTRRKLGDETGECLHGGETLDGDWLTSRSLSDQEP